jgi:hypothetical protein
MLVTSRVTKGLSEMKNRSLSIAVALLIVQALPAVGQMHDPMKANDTADTRSTEQKIAEAMAAGPVEVAKGARIIDGDKSGAIIVLREGSNGFTCTPGHGETLPAMCADTSNTKPGITYMLAGATQRSDSDPYDSTSPLISIGPHRMIMWPFDPAGTGLPATHRDTGSYIMWAGTPYAHVHVMGNPKGEKSQ